MHSDFTFMLLSQHHPYFQQLHIITNNDYYIEADVADLLPAMEEKVSCSVLKNIYAYASAIVLK